MTRLRALRDCAVVGLCLLVAWLGPQVWLSVQASERRPLDLVWAWLVPNVLMSTAAVGLAIVLTLPRRRIAPALGLRYDEMEIQFLWGLVGGAAAYGVFLMWLGTNWIIRYAMWRWGSAEMIASETTPDPGRAWDNLPIATMLALSVMPSVVEEVAFRGMLLNRLRCVTGRWWSAVAITSILFGAWHVLGGLEQVLNTALVSVVYCAIYIRSRSLIAAVVANGLYNVVQLQLGAWWSVLEWY